MNKKLVIGLLFVAGIASAACFGPFCWDDSGAYIGGRVTNGNGEGIPSMTLAQMNAATPQQAGQLIYVSNGLEGSVCVSSGTGRGAYVVVAASSTAVIGGLVGHCI